MYTYDTFVSLHQRDTCSDSVKNEKRKTKNETTVDETEKDLSIEEHIPVGLLYYSLVLPFEYRVVHMMRMRPTTDDSKIV